MIKNIKQFFALLITIIYANFHCAKPANFSDNYTNGSWVQYTTITSPKLDMSNLATSKFEVTGLKVFGSPSKIEIVWKYKGSEYVVKTLALSETGLIITPLELAKSIDKANTLPDDLAKYVTPGDQIKLLYYTYDGTGNKIITEIGNGLGSSANYKNLNNNFVANAVCKFVANDAVGTYRVEKDDWQEGATSLIITKIDDSTLSIEGYPVFDAPGDQKTTVVVSSDGTVNALKSSGKYGVNSYEVHGSGFVFSCAGTMSLVYNFFGPNTYLGQKLILKKS